MSGVDRTDALIAEWLSEGPTEASERLIDAVLGGARASSSPSPSVRRALQSGRSRVVGGALVAALVVAVAGVTGLTGWGPGRSGQAGPAGSAVGVVVGSQPGTSTSMDGWDGPWVPFISAEPAFSLSYPAAWRETRDYFHDGRSPITAFEANDRDAVIFISTGIAGGAATMPCGPIDGPPDAVRCTALQGSDVAALESAYGRFIERCCGAQPDPSTEHLLVAGTPAVVMETWNEPLVRGTVRDFTLAAVLVHADAPMAILWTSVLGDHAADRRDFLRFLGTVRFDR